MCEQYNRPLHDPTISVFSMSVSREEGVEKDPKVPVTLAQDEVCTSNGAF